MVEYTDANPFKELHIGHLMSNAIGEAVARTVLANGAEVRRANYQGDVGMHVAKALWAKAYSVTHLSDRLWKIARHDAVAAAKMILEREGEFMRTEGN